MPTYGKVRARCAECRKEVVIEGRPGFKLRKHPCPKCGALKLKGPDTTAMKARRSSAPSAAAVEPDWEGECSTCGASPIVPQTGLCGPCTFGEADTAGGNW